MPLDKYGFHWLRASPLGQSWPAAECPREFACRSRFSGPWVLRIGYRIHHFSIMNSFFLDHFGPEAFNRVCILVVCNIRAWHPQFLWNNLIPWCPYFNKMSQGYEKMGCSPLSRYKSYPFNFVFHCWPKRYPFHINLPSIENGMILQHKRSIFTS